MKLTTLIAMVAIGAIGMVGIDRYQTRDAEAAATPINAQGARVTQTAPVAMPADDRSWIKPRNGAPNAGGAASGQSRCDGRTHCSHMRSCEEATYFIQHCPNTKMDGDNDGVPCEEQWC